MGIKRTFKLVHPLFNTSFSTSTSMKRIFDVNQYRFSVGFQGVESERCPSFYKARKADRPTYTRIDSTLADGLAVPKVGYNAFATANPLIDKLVVVKEEWIAIAILKLVENEKCIVEGAGATGLAAILAGQLEELKGKRSFDVAHS